MSMQRLKKITATLSSVGISALILLIIVCLAHASATGSALGEYLSSVALPAAIAAIVIIGSAIFYTVGKKDASAERTGREELELFLAENYRGAFDKKGKAGALSIIKNRDLFDMLACQLSAASFVFAIDYILFIANYSGTTPSDGVLGVFAIAMAFASLGIAIQIARSYISDRRSREALSLLLSSLRTAEGKEAYAPSKAQSSGKFAAWLKERVRKMLVAIKKNPQAFPLLALTFSFLHFSLNLSSISNSTAKIMGQNMGLSAFVSMLLLLLSFVCMLSAFPKRQKPNYALVAIMLVMYVCVIIADINYINCINYATTREISPILITEQTKYIEVARSTMQTNIVCVAITALFVIIEPIIAKLLKKIKTSIDVEGQNIESIDISEEE